MALVLYSGIVWFKFFIFFFFKQKTAYEILTCDWSSDVCSSDLTDSLGLAKLKFMYDDILTLFEVHWFECSIYIYHISKLGIAKNHMYCSL